MTQAAASLARSTPVDFEKMELRKGDDFIIALDISASMQNTDCPNGLTRYKYAIEKCQQFAHEAAKYDDDGVSVYTFGAQVHGHENVTADKLDDLLSTKSFEGATMTHLLVQSAYNEHVKNGNEQTCLMVFTDGEPSDEGALLTTVANITQQLKSNEEFTMIFITVGKRSSSLEAFLTVLDDSLPGAKYDIVSVKALEDVDFASAFNSALTE